MKIGIIKERKTVPDYRVPLTPKQCALIKEKYGVEVVVEPSPYRCYSNAEYDAEGIELTTYLTDCDILMGVKEVPIDHLIDEHTYLFFSHTIKKQPHNKNLLKSIIQKRIRLIDYEKLEDKNGFRVIAFGKFAGMVGAHNGILTYGLRTKKYELPRMRSIKDYEAAKEVYKKLKLPVMKIVITGNGRVANGAATVLSDMGIQQVSPEDYLKKSYKKPVFTQLAPEYYVKRKDGKAFDLNHFFKNPDKYESIFAPYTKVSDVMINGIYWDAKAPAFFTKEEMKAKDFKIKTISDVTCDIAPQSSIPSTLRATTIAEPFFGYDPIEEKETAPFQDHVIDMTTIDNLPNEMPRDASEAFGNQFLEHVMEELLADKSEMIEKATIAENGDLGKHFEYLRDYIS